MIFIIYTLFGSYEFYLVYEFPFMFFLKLRKNVSSPCRSNTLCLNLYQHRLQVTTTYIQEKFTYLNGDCLQFNPILHKIYSTVKSNKILKLATVSLLKEKT